MANSERPLTQAESLALITSMINKAKEKVTESGTLYLAWGWLILFCCLVQFSALHFFNYPNAYFVWISTWLLLIYQFYYIRKKRKSRKVKTYMREINGYVWAVFFICLVLIFFIQIKLNTYQTFNPILLVMYGMPTFLSGIILKFKPLVIGAVCCWILSVICVFTPLEYQMLLISLAIIAGWIVPGYILKQKFKKEI